MWGCYVYMHNTHTTRARFTFYALLSRSGMVCLMNNLFLSYVFIG
jgi:hypothetical protein